MPTDVLPRLEVAAGALVFGQGEPGGSLLVIEEGEVAVSRRFLGGEVELRVLGPGSPLGVASFQGPEPREATARAVVDTKLLRLEPTLLAATLRERPDMGLRLLAALAAQLTAADAERNPISPTQAGSAADPPTQPVSLTTLRAADSPVVAALLWHPAGISFPLPDEGELVLGRFDGTRGNRPDIDLGELPEGRSVSRLHARVVVRGASVSVTEDQPARNGTFVNGQRVARGEPVELPDGAALRLGLVELRLLRSRP